VVTQSGKCAFYVAVAYDDDNSSSVIFVLNIGAVHNRGPGVLLRIIEGMAFVILDLPMLTKIAGSVKPIIELS
tara:strand:- start:1116 stop:1334 length:219 start_codon:yes stop_codon:yes gene_type:complete